MKQHYTSADTSINRNKLPAIYRKLSKRGILKGTVLDFGCGKYTAHSAEYCAENGADYHGVDKYNRTSDENLAEIVYCATHGTDIVICSNVLNVIDSEEEIDIILKLLPGFGRTYITVYEGDKTGKGKQTGKDQYQRNEPLKAYVERAKNLGLNVTARNGIIEIAPRT